MNCFIRISSGALFFLCFSVGAFAHSFPFRSLNTMVNEVETIALVRVVAGEVLESSECRFKYKLHIDKMYNGQMQDGFVYLDSEVQLNGEYLLVGNALNACGKKKIENGSSPAVFPISKIGLGLAASDRLWIDISLMNIDLPSSVARVSAGPFCDVTVNVDRECSSGCLCSAWSCCKLVQHFEKLLEATVAIPAPERP